ncbi:MAG TPA: DUF1080 domain-containing protein [Gemmataceae bacterium]|nr:DUF1080 domain-containing protein [Gemmataceae bacterium]
MFLRKLPLLAPAVLLAAAVALSLIHGEANSAEATGPPICGRWDLVVQGTHGDYPSWLEVRLSGRTTLVGAFVGHFGSARPISRVDFDGGHIHFAVPPQWESRKEDIGFDGKLDGDVIRGETTDDDGKRVTWTAKRAPSLERSKPPTWGKPVELFNGTDVTGWKPRSTDAKSCWEVKDGLLANTAASVDLVSEAKFNDSQLHTEFRYPAGGNSGVYLRGRYEVQIEDDYGQEPDSHGIGGVYGFLTPSVNAAKKAGEWQTLEVTLVGRTVTVLLNGERIIDRQAIPGVTGGALDSDEGAPGPILLQGDHGPVDFRKVTVTPGE